MKHHLTDQLKSDPDYLDRLLDEDQAAEFLGFTNRALQNWRFRGGGPLYVKASARSVRYRRRDLMNWAEQRVRANTSQADPK